MIVHVRGGDDLVGLCEFEELEQAALSCFRRADDRAHQGHAGGSLFRGRPEGIDVVNGRRNLPGHSTAKIGERLLDGCEKKLGLGVRFGDEDIHAEHGVGASELARRLEAGAIEFERLHHVGRREMRCERKRQTHFCRKLRAEEARTEQPYRHTQARSRNSANFLVSCCWLEIGLQFFNVLRKIVRGRGHVSAQSVRGEYVSARGAAEAKIDAIGIQRGECSELLDDDERSMIWQHDAAGADANGFRAASDIANHDRRGGAGDAGHTVMLRQPEAVVPPGFGVLREVERVAQGHSCGGIFWNRREI